MHLIHGFHQIIQIQQKLPMIPKRKKNGGLLIIHKIHKNVIHYNIHNGLNVSYQEWCTSPNK